MENITLTEFQLKAIDDLMTSMGSLTRDIVLKSCTGSGKTIILTHFMDEYFKSFSKTVFVWLTPGKGNLEEQSKSKMDKYIYGSSTKLLSDVMTGGFEENDACFINWEKLIKKGNNALKDGERTNFIEHIEKALNDGLHFVIIVDESHQNDTVKADDILDYFKTDKIIRCSATPKGYTNAIIIDIPEEDVIAEGLIKKLLIINQDFPQNIEVESQIEFLLEKAILKQKELHSDFLQRNSSINPLIIVQLPNKSDALLEGVEKYFESKGITYENRQLAIWLSEKKENIEEITEIDAEPIAVIIKQAIATGWDCPRAHILVKLRDNMSETFEIQTIGRIRRMPEAKHYESDLLDSCYLFTLDEKFTEGVKTHLGQGALEALKVFLKPEHRDFSIVSEYKTDVPFPQDAKLALRVIHTHFNKKDKTTSDVKQNKTRLETKGYKFSGNIIDYTKSGALTSISKSKFDELNDIAIQEKLSTHKHGKEYHHCVSDIGRKINLDYNSINTILRRLFLRGIRCDSKILSLETRELYSFVINNKYLLADDVQDAMANEALQLALKTKNITEKPTGLPLSFLFTYDSTSKTQNEMTKNVYKGYLTSAEVRSSSEKLFEKHCESSSKIVWFYKNGDKGFEYFSIVYEDNFGKQKSFYPDYIICDINSNIWVIETKGGFSKSGNSEDIDKFTSKKFEVLKKYLDKYNLQGGIVRQDKQSFELCICTESYSDNIKDDCWKLLSDML